MTSQRDPGQIGEQPGTDASARRAFSLPAEWWWLRETGDGELIALLADYQAKMDAAQIWEQDDIARTFLKDLNSTTWWQESTLGWRAAEELRLTDFGTWEQIIEINTDDAHRFASQLGYSLTKDQADDLAVRMAEENLTDAEVERSILNTVYYSQMEGPPAATTPQAFGKGSIRDVRDDLQSRADQWLAVFDKGALDRMAHDYKSEKITEDQMYQTIVDQSYSQHEWLDPDFVNNLFQRGLTLSDHLAPMKNEVANVWGMKMDEVSLDDPFFNESLVTTDDKGVSRFINSREAKALAYKDPRYRKTTEYRGKMNEFAGAMAEFLGVRSWR